MTAGDLLAFGGSALRGHRLRTLLSLLGVAIGVASVVLLTSLGEGARRYVTGEFANLGTNLLIITPGRVETTGGMPIFGGVPHELTLDDAEAVQRYVRSIRRVAAMSVGEAPVRYGERSREITVVGTTPEMMAVRNLKLRAGRYLPEGDPDRGPRVAVIGIKIQRELFVGENPLGEFLRIGDERYRVIGVMAPRGVSLGMDLDDLVHVPVARAMKLFNREGLFRIMAEVGNQQDMEAAKAQTREILIERHDGEEDFTLLTQDSVLSTFNRILEALTAALGGIAAVSLSVAGIGIMNIMLVSVTERVREIGLLKALGANPRQILGVFLVEASILSTLGGLAGLGAGYGGVRVLTAVFPAFPAAPPLWAVAAGLGLAILTGVVFGMLPARRASRLDPVAALAGR